MRTFEITATKCSDSYTKDFETTDEARDWVINTLDLSMEWTIKDTSEYITRLFAERLEYRGEDYWGRDLYLDVKNKTHFAMVDGVLHFITRDGEPDCPVSIAGNRITETLMIEINNVEECDTLN